MRTLPNNPDIERKIIGAFFEMASARDEIALNVKLNMFYNDRHKSIFIRGLELYQDNKKFTFEIVSSLLKEDYFYILQECANQLPSSESIKPLIEDLQEVYRLRELHVLGLKIIDSIETFPSNKILRSIELNVRNFHTNGAKIERISEIIDNYSTEEQFNDLYNADVKTGIKEIDNLVKIKKGHFIIIAGRPSMGKTAFMLYMAKMIARRHRVGIISIEMLSKFLLLRLAFSESNETTYKDYQNGCAQIASLPIFINDENNYKIENIVNISKTMIKRYKIDIVFLDYLQIANDESKRTRYEEITALSQRFKWLAKDTTVPHVVLSQLSRASDSRAGYLPQLSDLRESGQIEQDADIVMFPFRPGYYKSIKENHEQAKTKENYPYKHVQDIETYFKLIVAKQREYKTGEIEMYYNTNNNYFAPITKIL